MVGEDLEGRMDWTASLKDGSGCMDPRGGRGISGAARAKAKRRAQTACLAVMWRSHGWSPKPPSAGAPCRRREGTPPLRLVALVLVLLLLTSAHVAWRRRPAAWLGMRANFAWNRSLLTP